MIARNSRELNTIQKRHKLNTVNSVGEKGPGGAYHEYNVACVEPIGKDTALNPDADMSHLHEILLTVNFQKGPRNDASSVRGVLDVDLLEIVRDRLICFQEGPFACDANARALEHLELALMYMSRRVDERNERGVLGTNQT